MCRYKIPETIEINCNSRFSIINKILPNDSRKMIPLIAVFIIIFLFCVIIIIIILSPKDDSFTNSCVMSHNNYRYKHGVSSLQSASNLVAFATERANYLASTDIFEHAHDLKGYGENLHYIKPFKEYPCHNVTALWYSEIKFYNYNNPLRSSGPIGHFTQVIWEETRRIGCAQSYSKRSERIYTVCIYDPPGNSADSMEKNVPRPLT